MKFPIAIHIQGQDELVTRTFNTLKDAREQARRIAHEGILVEHDAITTDDPPIFIDAFYGPHRIERIDILTMEAAPAPEPETPFVVNADEPPSVGPSLDSALFDALTIGDGFDRFDALSRTGATDEQIKAVLGDLWTQSPEEFALGLSNSTRYGALIGGEDPHFIPRGTGTGDDRPVGGPALIAKVRELMGIGPAGKDGTEPSGIERADSSELPS